MELALALLDLIAPDVEPPISYRQGGAPPRFVRVAAGELLDVALLEAAGLDGLVAVIAPPSLAGGASGETFDESSVPILTPRQAKGLEFDHVVVVEPALIVDEGGDSGLRELYVALTRPTKTLSIVHAGPLPDALA
jgi:superfamily I DNA/RNA helicase